MAAAPETDLPTMSTEKQAPELGTDLILEIIVAALPNVLLVTGWVSTAVVAIVPCATVGLSRLAYRLRTRRCPWIAAVTLLVATVPLLYFAYAISIALNTSD